MQASNALPKFGLYHWVVARIASQQKEISADILEDTIPLIKATWTEKQIGGEHCLTGRSGKAEMFFGLGPALSAVKKTLRAKALLKAMAPELQAVRWCEQIHSRLVASLGQDRGHAMQGAMCVGRCDALMTDESAIGLLIWTADCVPVLFTGSGVVAAVHSGWRGAASDIVGTIVRRYEVEYGVTPDQLEAFLGPSISGPFYEVGDEVIEALRVYPVDEDIWRSGRNVDLRAFLSSRLEGLGLSKSAILSVGPCTASSPGLASYRREGDRAGRQWSLIYRRDSVPGDE